MVRQATSTEDRRLQCMSRNTDTRVLYPNRGGLPNATPIHTPSEFPHFRRAITGSHRAFSSCHCNGGISLTSTRRSSQKSPMATGMAKSRHRVSHRTAHPTFPRIPSRCHKSPLGSPTHLTITLVTSIPTRRHPTDTDRHH